MILYILNGESIACSWTLIIHCTIIFTQLVQRLSLTPYMPYWTRHIDTICFSSLWQDIALAAYAVYLYCICIYYSKISVKFFPNVYFCVLFVFNWIIHLPTKNVLYFQKRFKINYFFCVFLCLTAFFQLHLNATRGFPIVVCVWMCNMGKLTNILFYSVNGCKWRQLCPAWSYASQLSTDLIVW